MKSLKTTVCALGTLFFSLAPVASAATNYWVSANGGDLADANNWSGNVLPTPDSVTAITNANEIALTLSQPLTLAKFYLGKAGRTFSLDATLTLSNQNYMTALSGSGVGARMELSKGTICGLLNPSLQYLDYLSSFYVATGSYLSNSLVLSGPEACIRDQAIYLESWSSGRNTLTMTNGAKILECTLFTSGGGGKNKILIAGEGTVFSNSHQYFCTYPGINKLADRNGLGLTVGEYNSLDNTMWVQDGADFSTGSAMIGAGWPANNYTRGGNTLVVSNATFRILNRNRGGIMYLYVGYQSSNNTMIATGPSAKVTAGQIVVGTGPQGGSNVLTIANGATVFATFINIAQKGPETLGGRNNICRITGEGTTAGTGLWLGIDGGYNYAEITDNAVFKLYSGGIKLGSATATAVSNTLVVSHAMITNTGAWNAYCGIGIRSPGNALILTNQAVFVSKEATPSMVVGEQAGSDGNRICLDNSRLEVTTLTNGLAGVNNRIEVTGTNSALTIYGNARIQNASVLKFTIPPQGYATRMLAVTAPAGTCSIAADTVITVEGAEWAKTAATATLATFTNDPDWDFQTLASNAVLPKRTVLKYENKTLSLRSLGPGGTVIGVL